MEEGKRKEYEDHPVPVGEQSCKIKSHSHSNVYINLCMQMIESSSLTYSGYGTS